MSEPAWVAHVVVDAIHVDQLREHGGLAGLRDENALESALARPQQKWHYQPESDLPTLAAAYGFGLATSHPYRDANKRTAFLVMATFLGLNGFELDAADADVVGTMLALADHRCSERQLAAWIRARRVRIPRK